MTDIFPIDDQYQRKHTGIYGEFGAGANARVRFVQTAMRPETLMAVTLISSIPGSEKWDVVDLFQRNVDSDRVTNGIIPYLEDHKKIKFFNPLTLVVLQLEESGKNVYKDLPILAPTSDERFKYLTNEPFYQLRLSHDETYGAIEWNPERCRLVAIDGQHRLSALQRSYKQPHPKVDISTWKVPVVMMIIEKEDPAKNSASLLQLIRNTFVYINTQAVRINSSREILLNDESPNAVCTQEFVRYCHGNDVKPLKERDHKRIPLLLIDWRGDTSDKRPVLSPAALKTVEEVNLWHRAYILGEDFSDDQRKELGVDDAVPRLTGYRKDGALSATEAKWIRESYTKDVLPGLMYFLEEFEPYNKYIAKLRASEERHVNESDTKQHAFMQLRFGTNNAPEEQKDEVRQMYNELVNEISGLKGTLPDLVKKDIGMRAVIFALGKLKRVVTDDRLASRLDRMSWKQFCQDAVPYFNELHSEHWFDDINDSHFKGKRHIPEFLFLIAFESNGNVANYRISDMEGGLGSLLSLIAGAKMVSSRYLNESALKEFWEEQQIFLEKTIQKEARKMHKAILKPTFEGTLDQFNARVKREAEATASQRIKEIGKYIGV